MTAVVLAASGIYWTASGILSIVIIVWATLIGSRKGRPFVGFLLGFFLSLIGVLIIYLIPPKQGALAR